MDRSSEIQAQTGKKPHIVVQTPDVRVVEYVMQPGASQVWHHHSEVTDRFYCLEGEIEVQLRESGEARRLHPGDSFMVLPGTVHRAGNAAPGVSRYLLVQAVGRYDFVKA